ncbi:MAG: hypothetical protein PUB10_03075 [Clostridiales bacterium]|nr:hypothetical protein [Clostridiales bacterium]
MKRLTLEKKTRRELTCLLFMGTFALLAGLLSGNLLASKNRVLFSEIGAGLFQALETEASVSVPIMQMFFYISLKRVETYLLIWIFAVTIWKYPYEGFLSIKYGYMQGILLSFYAGNYGLKGFLLYLRDRGLIFSAYLLLYVETILYLNNHRIMEERIRLKKKNAGKMIPAFLFHFLFFLGCCLLESYFYTRSAIR